VYAQTEVLLCGVVDQLATAAVAVGHRAGRAATGPGHPCTGRFARSRGEPARPPTVPLIWTTHSTDLADLAADPEVIADYKTQRRGPLASNLCEAGAFFATDDSATTPDIASPRGRGGIRRRAGQTRRPCFTASVSLLTPRSRGNLRLRSTDPAQAPDIDLNFYADHTDTTAVVAGIRTLARSARPGH